LGRFALPAHLGIAQTASVKDRPCAFLTVRASVSRLPVC
jgi:hypothetical protein